MGEKAFNLLRWIILSNLSQLFHLPLKIEIKSLSSSGCFQFIALISSPEQEDIFQQLKSKYSSFFMWYGSPTWRWHSIIKTDLKIGKKSGYGSCSEIYMATS